MMKRLAPGLFDLLIVIYFVSDIVSGLNGTAL